ncbi:MAG: hypothetical protein ABW036_11500 [Flavitalea sp.]
MNGLTGVSFRVRFFALLTAFVGYASDCFGLVGVRLENLSDEIPKIGVLTWDKDEFGYLKEFTNQGSF